MIALDPAARPTFDSLLHTSRGTVFPESFFSYLHNYVSSINEPPSSSMFGGVAAPNSASSTVISHATPTSAGPPPRMNSTAGMAVTIAEAVGTELGSREALPGDSDHRMERIWAEYESVEPYLLAPDADGEATVVGVKPDFAESVGASKPFRVST